MFYQINKSSNKISSFQIFDLLQMSRREKESRHACRISIGRFMQWRRGQNKKHDGVLAFHAQVEGLLLRRQAQDAVLIYRAIRHERIRAFRDYLDRLPQQDSLFRAAS